MDPSQFPWVVTAVVLLSVLAVASAHVLYPGLRAGFLSRRCRDPIFGLAAIALLLVYCALLPCLSSGG